MKEVTSDSRLEGARSWMIMSDEMSWHPPKMWESDKPEALHAEYCSRFWEKKMEWKTLLLVLNVNLPLQRHCYTGCTVAVDAN